MEDLVVELGEVPLSNRDNGREEQQTQKKTPLVSILRSPQILWLITMWPALIDRNKLKEGLLKSVYLCPMTLTMLVLIM